MFPSEAEEDLVHILTKNNFGLEKSINEVLCGNAGAVHTCSYELTI